MVEDQQSIHIFTYCILRMFERKYIHRTPTSTFPNLSVGNETFSSHSRRVHRSCRINRLRRSLSGASAGCRHRLMSGRALLQAVTVAVQAEGLIWHFAGLLPHYCKSAFSSVACPQSHADSSQTRTSRQSGQLSALSCSMTSCMVLAAPPPLHVWALTQSHQNAQTVQIAGLSEGNMIIQAMGPLCRRLVLTQKKTQLTQSRLQALRTVPYLEADE